MESRKSGVTGEWQRAFFNFTLGTRRFAGRRANRVRTAQKDIKP
jgi:hypothetical protein